MRRIPEDATPPSDPRAPEPIRIACWVSPPFTVLQIAGIAGYRVQSPFLGSVGNRAIHVLERGRETFVLERPEQP